MLLAQLTDTHILNPASTEERWVDNNGRLESAVASLNREQPRPKVVLATGDLTNNAAEGELDELLRLLEPLELPVLALPGNHDDRDQIRGAFDLPWAAEDNLSWVVELDGLVIIGLDTTVPSAHHGDFDTSRHEWLAKALADSGDRPVLIAMHHPPFASGIGWMDRSMLRRSEAFVEMVGAHANVTRILCGHLHRPIVSTVAGVLTSIGPSTVHHVALDTTESAPIELIRDPTGYHLHHFDGATWVSHMRYIETGEEPIRPSWAADGVG